MSDITTSQNNISNKVNPLDPVPPHLAKVEGIHKLRRLITKELTSANADDKCSNLPHLLSIVSCILNNNNNVSGSGTDSSSGVRTLPPPLPPSAVLKPFNYTHGKSKRFIVDIVSADGTEWCKVSARNPRSLTLLACGGGGFGQKSILDHAVDYIQCAEQNPAFFKPPSIKFIFTSGISSSLADQLLFMGISVDGEIIEDSELRAHPRIKTYQDCCSNNTCKSSSSEVEEESNSNCSTTSSTDNESTSLMLRNPILENVTRLNLDITALLAYVSNLTNGHTNVDFTKPILKEQLQMEKERPQKPVLDQIFHGRELWCCHTAMREFQAILSTVGGPAEQYRAGEFLKRIKIVPDCMSERSKSLDIIGNVKLRSLTIFGSGDYYEAVTVTANSGFVRSAHSQGVDFAVVLHESRALTEGKEKDLILDLEELCSTSNLNMNISM